MMNAKKLFLVLLIPMCIASVAFCCEEMDPPVCSFDIDFLFGFTIWNDNTLIWFAPIEENYSIPLRAGIVISLSAMTLSMAGISLLAKGYVFLKCSRKKRRARKK